MSAETQFIVITHAKRTMEAAQALYGVTMQEPGLSSLVSVRFDSAPQGAAAPPNVALAAV
jgi:chromosome segregation protein